LIHSEEVVVQRAPVPVGTPEAPVFEDRAWGFEVTSDRDAGKKSHFVFVHSLIEAFLQTTDVDDVVG
jgi:hypothetical protein